MNAATEPDIFVYCDRKDDRRISHDLVYRYGKVRVAAMDSLAACLCEAPFPTPQCSVWGPLRLRALIH